MADPPPNDGMGAERSATGRRRLSEEEWEQSLENMEESEAEEAVSEYSDCPSDGSVDVEKEYEKELEEQRIEDEKNGHFADVRDRNLSNSGQNMASGKHAAVVSTISMAAHQSRVLLATHKARALAKNGMNLSYISAEGGAKRDGVSLGNFKS